MGILRVDSKRLFLLLIVNLFLVILVDATGTSTGLSATSQPSPSSPGDQLSSADVTPHHSPLTTPRDPGTTAPDSKSSGHSGVSLSRIEEVLVGRPRDYVKDFFSKRSSVDRIYIDPIVAPTFNDGGIHLICHRLPNIKRLALDSCSEITDASLDSVSALKHLEQLSIQRCSKVTPKGLRYIKSLKKLTYLNLRACSNLTEETVRELISGLRESKRDADPKLELVVFPDGEQVDPEGAFEVSRDGVCTFKKRPSSLTESQLHGLLLAGPSVSRVAFEGEAAVPLTDLDLQNMASRFTNLEEFNLPNCSQLTDAGVESLRNCALRTLNLNNCPQINTLALWELLCTLKPTLETFNFDDKDGQRFDSEDTLKQKADSLYQGRRKLEFEKMGSDYFGIQLDRKNAYALNMDPSKYVHLDEAKKQRIHEQVSWIKELSLPLNRLHAFVNIIGGPHPDLDKSLASLSYLKLIRGNENGSKDPDLSEEQQTEKDIDRLKQVAASLPQLELISLQTGLHLDPQKGFCMTPDACCEFKALPSTFNERQLKGFQRIMPEIKSIKWDEGIRNTLQVADANWVLNHFLSKRTDFSHLELSGLVDSIPKLGQFTLKDKEGRAYSNKQAFVAKRVEEFKKNGSELIAYDAGEFSLLKRPSTLSERERRFFLEQAPHVEKMKLKPGLSLSDEDLTELKAFSKLKELDLGWSKWGDVKGDPNIRISAEGWKSLVEMTQLQRISFHDYPSKDLPEMKALAHTIPNLIVLELPSGRRISSGKAWRTTQTAKVSVCCFNKRPSELTSNQLGGLSTLESVVGIDFFKGSQEVSRNITDQDLELISNRLPKLKYFQLMHAAKITESGLMHLRKLEDLDHVQLVDAKQISEKAFLEFVKALRLTAFHFDNGSDCKGIVHQDQLERRIARTQLKEEQKVFLENGSDCFERKQNAEFGIDLFNLIKLPSGLSEDGRALLKKQAGWVKKLKIASNLIAQFQPADWDFVEHFESLEFLWLNDPQNGSSGIEIPDSAKAKIKALPKIRSVILPNGRAMGLGESFNLSRRGGTCFFHERPSALSLKQIIQLASISEYIKSASIDAEASKSLSQVDIETLGSLFPNLKHLSLEDSQNLVLLAEHMVEQLSRLESLSLDSYRYKDLNGGNREVVESLAKLDSLKAQIAGSKLSVNSLIELMGLEPLLGELGVLDIYGCERDDVHYNYELKKRPSSFSQEEMLAYVTLGRYLGAIILAEDIRKEFSDSDLKTLLRLTPELSALGLCGCEKLTSKGLIHIKDLSELECLDLGGCVNLTDEGMASVGKLTKLKKLYLWKCEKLTSLALAHISRLTQLRSLNLSCCSQLAIDSNNIGKLTQLESLNLACCKGLVDSSLDCLKALHQLRSLNLYGCDNVTKGAIEALRAALPKCDIKVN